MIENPKTIDDVRANLAEAQRIADFKKRGLSDGEAEFAVSTEAELRKLNNPGGTDSPNIENFKRMGMSDAEADFAAGIVLPG